MSEQKNQGSYEVIQLPNKLKHKVKVTGRGRGVDLAAIKRAESALAELSDQFDGWLGDEIGKLKDARRQVHEAGINSTTVETMFRASHDIKGQGATLGYSLATDICASLCKLLESVEPVGKIPLPLIDQHVDAVVAVYRENMKAPDHPVGAAVAEKLLDVVLEFIGGLPASPAATGDKPDERAAS